MCSLTQTESFGRNVVPLIKKPITKQVHQQAVTLSQSQENVFAWSLHPLVPNVISAILNHSEIHKNV